jgi:hypothetical protein
MHRLVRIRLSSVAALVMTGSIAFSAFAMPASAAAVVKTTCSSVTLTIKGTGTLKKCNDPTGTGTSGKLVVNTKKAPYPATFTWNKTGTTKASLKYAPAAKTAKKVCATGTTEIDVSGTVTGGTGAALKAIPKGGKVSAKLCYKGTTLTLAPKTVFTL